MLFLFGFFRSRTRGDDDSLGFELLSLEIEGVLADEARFAVIKIDSLAAQQFGT